MRSVLKWVGGKQGIIETLKTALPAGNRLVEPFMGSATVMLNTHYPEYLLADVNHDLISMYESIRQEPYQVIEHLRHLYATGKTKEKYYAFRNEFNKRDLSRLAYRAALFIYLNRYGYRGLCRYNREQGFNSPWGYYKKPFFPEAEIHHMSARLAGVELVCGDFSTTLSLVKPGDVVYCDPPYPEPGKFTDYHASGFSIEQQRELISLLRKLSETGVHVVASCHDADDIRDMYEGFDILSISAPRNVYKGVGKGKRADEIIAVLSPEKLSEKNVA